MFFLKSGLFSCCLLHLHHKAKENCGPGGYLITGELIVVFLNAKDLDSGYHCPELASESNLFGCSKDRGNKNICFVFM